VTSISSHDIQKYKRIVLKLPDGSYSHAYRSGEKDAWLENRDADQNVGSNPNDEEQILHIEDEVDFLLNNFEFILEPEQAVKNYMYHRKVLCVFLVLSVMYEFCLDVYLWKNKEFIITQLTEVYKNLDVDKLTNLFIYSNTIDLMLNLTLYGFGFYSLRTHKVNTFQWFNTLMLMSIFTRIIISYLNILNLLMFILKIIVYLYARFVLSFLYSVLLLPNIV